MRKSKLLTVLVAAAIGVSMVGCGSSGGSSSSGSGGSSSGGDVANKDKPLCWYNRQPSNSSTGELDKTALTFNDKTYYVGFDANQGAELQGQMVLEYIKKNIDKIDRNGDGVIGYVLAIGDIGHNDSIARTCGVRSQLGTAVEKDGSVDSSPAGWQRLSGLGPMYGCLMNQKIPGPRNPGRCRKKWSLYWLFVQRMRKECFPGSRQRR